jgi:hypothetical protein
MMCEGFVRINMSTSVLDNANHHFFICLVGHYELLLHSRQFIVLVRRPAGHPTGGLGGLSSTDYRRAPRQRAGLRDRLAHISTLYPRINSPLVLAKPIGAHPRNEDDVLRSPANLQLYAAAHFQRGQSVRSLAGLSRRASCVSQDSILTRILKARTPHRNGPAPPPSPPRPHQDAVPVR